MTILIKDLFKTQDLANILIENCVPFKSLYSVDNQCWIINVEGNAYLDGLGSLQDFLTEQKIEFYEKSYTN